MRYWENIMQAETILVCTRLFFDKRFTPFLLKAISNVHRYKYSLFVTRNRRIFSILTFLINIWQMNSVKRFLSSKFGPFKSHHSVRCDLWRTHITAHGMTHFPHKNESYPFEWCDSNMSHATPLGATHFGLKLTVYFLYHLHFYN
jgi:hypothetical protein